MPAVALVDVLDHLLAPIAARQVQVDVGPLAPRLGQEALEQEVHADGIDRGEAEAVADRAVGGRAAPLHEDAVGTTVLHELPHDEEVAREVEPADQVELARNLLPGTRGEGPVPVALPRALLGERPEVRDRRLARRQRVIGKAIPEVLQREVEARRQLPGVGDGVGPVGEQALHRARRLERALGVPGEAVARVVEVHVLADAREHVGHRAPARAAVHRLVRRDEQRPLAVGEREQPLGPALLGPVEMALDLDEAAASPEDAEEPVEMGVGGPGQAHEAARVRLDVIERGGGPGELRLRDQATEVLVSLPLLHEERQPRAVPERQLAADDRAEPELRHGPIEPRGAVNTVTVHEGEGGHLEPRRRLGERLRLLRRLEKRERRLRVQL